MPNLIKPVCTKQSWFITELGYAIDPDWDGNIIGSTDEGYSSCLTFQDEETFGYIELVWEMLRMRWFLFEDRDTILKFEVSLADPLAIDKVKEKYWELCSKTK